MEELKTIREVSILWKKDKQQYVKQSTLSAYALILENHILPIFGDKHQLLEKDVQDFTLLKLQEGLSQKTVKDTSSTACISSRPTSACSRISRPTTSTATTTSLRTTHAQRCVSRRTRQLRTTSSTQQMTL